jgi:hypothetical protein
LREYHLTLNEQFFTYIMARTSYSRCDDNDVRFILVQLPYLDLYSASSMKLQSAGRHDAPLGHIVLVPSQTFLNAACLAENQGIQIVFADRIMI